MCQSLLRILKNENMIQYFKGLCVDDENVRRSLPPQIKRVPTAMIPAINKIFVADEIFQWLQSIKMTRIQHSSAQSNNINQQTLPSRQTVNNSHNKQSPNNQPRTQTCPAGPIGFVSHEMSGLSDMYAYTTVDEIPRHTYLSCNELDKSTIFTAPEKQAKITLGIQPSFIKDIERKRKDQDDSIDQIFKAQQKNIDIINVKRRETDNVINQIVEKQQQKIFGLFDETIK
jgi:hypothetical protein